MQDLKLNGFTLSPGVKGMLENGLVLTTRSYKHFMVLTEWKEEEEEEACLYK